MADIRLLWEECDHEQAAFTARKVQDKYQMGVCPQALLERRTLSFDTHR